MSELKLCPTEAELEERVARALYGPDTIAQPPWPSLSGYERHLFIMAARAAIRAMRELPAPPEP